MPIEENVQITPSKKQDVRAAIAPIVDTVIVLGCQGLSFRGHKDDSKYHPEPVGFAKESVGNFVEFLQFRVRGGDIHLKKHLEKSAKNATYISKESQNDFIKHAGEAISDRIIEEVKKSGLYSIIADEARDCSNKEQMSLVLRYVDFNLDIRMYIYTYIYLLLPFLKKNNIRILY